MSKRQCIKLYKWEEYILKLNYQKFFEKISKVENLTKEESEFALQILNIKWKEILDLRKSIKEYQKEYTELQYFFVVYGIMLKSKIEKSDYIEFKNGNGLTKINSVLLVGDVKVELNHFANETEYLDKYKSDYNILIDKTKIIPNGTDEIIINCFWKILE